MKMTLIYLLITISAAFSQLLNDSVEVESVSPPSIVKAEWIWSNDTISLGDSVTLTITLSWTEARHPLLFKANEGQQFNNLEFRGVKVSQEKKYTVLGYKNLTTYTYSLMSLGPGNAGSNRFTYSYEHMGEKFEVEIPSLVIEVLPKRDKTVTILMIILAILLVTSILVFFMYKRKKKERESSAANSRDFKSELEILRKRVKKTDSRNVLKEIDEMACAWLRKELGGIEQKGVHELYEQYAMNVTEHSSEWQHILGECDHLRFGGGRREEFELLETIKKLYVCFKVKEENE